VLATGAGATAAQRQLRHSAAYYTYVVAYHGGILSLLFNAEPIVAPARREIKMQNAKCKMQNAKCKMQNAKCKMQNANPAPPVLHFAFCILHFALRDVSR
jgi:hypothetical protein